MIWIACYAYASMLAIVLVVEDLVVILEISELPQIINQNDCRNRC
jgi:hypothetical protein